MDIKNKVKQPTTYQEQIEILVSKGLIINNTKKAIEILKQINYYRLTGYMLSLKRDDIFINGSTIEDVYTIYEFDKKLRLLLIEILEDIEINFRTHITYNIAHKYGTLGYQDSNNFLKQKHHNEFINILKKELDKRQELFIKHHKINYNGQFPIWVIVDILSFSALSKLFHNMKIKDKQEISKEYYNLPYEYLESWLNHFSYIRNICAHYGRLYNRSLSPCQPRLSKKDKKENLVTDKIFITFYILRKLYLKINKNNWTTFIIRLEALIENYDCIDKNLIGFPDNWRSVLNNMNTQ